MNIQATSNPSIDLEKLSHRLGHEALKQRLNLQIYHNEGFLGQSDGIWKIEDYIHLDRLITLAFKLTGLYKRGRRNFLDIQVVENTIVLDRLPTAFEGFRILHIADLHTDLEPDLPDVVLELIQGLDYDLCVNTGDFRNKTNDCFHKSLTNPLKCRVR